MISAFYPKKMVVASAKKQIEYAESKIKESKAKFAEEVDKVVRKMVKEPRWWRRGASYQDAYREFFETTEYILLKIEFDDCPSWKQDIKKMKNIIHLAETAPSGALIISSDDCGFIFAE